METFCSNLNSLFNIINKFQPSCSILLSDFNAKFSEWCSSDKNNTTGINAGVNMRTVNHMLTKF